jgi:rhodanese-related sulfurtransferase
MEDPEMHEEVNRYQVRDMLAEGAQLIEVLPREDYEPVHLPGAINFPLEAFESEFLEQFDKRLPVIVYCANPH